MQTFLDFREPEWKKVYAALETGSRVEGREWGREWEREGESERERERGCGREIEIDYKAQEVYLQGIC